MTQIEMPERYPEVAGHQDTWTSRQAALTTPAKTLRGIVTKAYIESDRLMTADECADLIGRSLLSIRPRVTELKRLGMLHTTGETRKNVSGKQADVMVPTELARQWYRRLED